MFTDKRNILQLAALLRAHGVGKVVLCPGSRDIPIVQTLLNSGHMDCYAMTDERSAGFFALGLALHEGVPVAVCCTSGTALLNLHPAVAEAYYQQVPLVVISADRPSAWIGQMDGQTLPQPGVFGSLVKRSVHLPEVHTAEDEWYCNRLANEALLELTHHGMGPVHINVPVSEPFFQLPVHALPTVRVIHRYTDLGQLAPDGASLSAHFNRYHRRMAVVGQTAPTVQADAAVAGRLSGQMVWIAEQLGRHAVPGKSVAMIDRLLASVDEAEMEALRPQLLITYGGHVVSKRLKQFLRKHPPVEHWHVAADGAVVDLYGCLTAVIEMAPADFLAQLASLSEGNIAAYSRQWEVKEAALAPAVFAYSEMQVVGKVLQALPVPSVLHLANSSVVRYAQMFDLPEGVEVLANRGTSGIEGSLSTAVGYAAVSEKLNFVFIGDLSFFYDMNALWNGYCGNNLRILVLNNGGGEIFHSLPGLELSPEARRYVAGTHAATAKAWAVDRGFDYVPVYDEATLLAALPAFADSRCGQRPMLLEAFTDAEMDANLLKKYYQNLKL